jgi:hypothetical protein
MAHSQFADEGDDIQMWKVPWNRFSKQSQLVYKGWSSPLGLGGRDGKQLQAVNEKKSRNVTRGRSGFLGRLKQRKMDMRFGTGV